MAITKNIGGRGTEILSSTFLFTSFLSHPSSNKCEDCRKCIRLWGYLSSSTSLHWWIARRLEANVNLVNTSNTQKIPLSTCVCVCVQARQSGMVSPVSANVLPAADLLFRLPPESSVVNRKMFPRDSSEDSLSACDRLQMYGTTEIITDRKRRRLRVV